MMINTNIYYLVENEEEAKWIVNKMYEEGYSWNKTSRTDTKYYESIGNTFGYST